MKPSSTQKWDGDGMPSSAQKWDGDGTKNEHAMDDGAQLGA